MKRRRWTRRALGAAVGLTLGWLAAGYAQDARSPAAPADGEPVEYEPPRLPDAPPRPTEAEAAMPR